MKCFICEEEKEGTPIHEQLPFVCGRCLKQGVQFVLKYNQLMEDLRTGKASIIPSIHFQSTEEQKEPTK